MEQDIIKISYEGKGKKLMHIQIQILSVIQTYILQDILFLMNKNPISWY